MGSSHDEEVDVEMAAGGSVPIGSNFDCSPQMLQGSRIRLVPVRPMAACKDKSYTELWWPIRSLGEDRDHADVPESAWSPW